MIYYVIPAREGSKGFVHKNRRLWPYTENLLKSNGIKNVIVSTDDPEIKKLAASFTIHNRKKETSSDSASTKSVLLEIIKDFNMLPDDEIILLYLTYPERIYKDIYDAYKKYRFMKADSLLCKKPVKTHPYLCIYEDGAQVIEHNLCRRQEYPQVYEISHYIGIFKVSGIKDLNNNLYNSKTVYYDISDIVDVDYEEDLCKLH